MLCVTLCFTTGCAQKVEDKKFLECSFHFNRIMSNDYSKEEYECFLNKSENFYNINISDFFNVADIFDFKLLNRYDNKLNYNLELILEQDSILDVKYRNLKNLELSLNGAEMNHYYDEVYINQLKVLVDDEYKNAIVRPWRDYQLLRFSYVTNKIDFFDFFNIIYSSGLLESSDKCIIANDLYYKFTKIHLKKDTITNEWLDSMQTLETVLSKVCPNECLLSRTEWYAFLKDKRFYNFNCDTLGYFHSMYNMCSEMIYLTEQDTIPFSKIKETRIKMDKMWSMDQYFDSYLGKHVYGFIVKAKAYEYFYEGKYEEFENLIWYAEDNGYIWIWRGDFKFRRNQEVTNLYEKMFKKDPFSIEAEEFYYKNFPKLFSI